MPVPVSRKTFTEEQWARAWRSNGELLIKRRDVKPLSVSEDWGNVPCTWHMRLWMTILRHRQTKRWILLHRSVTWSRAATVHSSCCMQEIFKELWELFFWRCYLWGFGVRSDVDLSFKTELNAETSLTWTLNTILSFLLDCRWVDKRASWIHFSPEILYVRDVATNTNVFRAVC